MTYKIFAYYYKNGSKIKVCGKSTDNFVEAKTEAYALEAELASKHISIFDRTPVVVKNTKTGKTYEVDNDYEGYRLVSCNA